MKITEPFVVYLPDTRDVYVSRYGRGNLKLGPDVYTYSRLPGHPSRPALGTDPDRTLAPRGTCPGASSECERICYASRPVSERGPVARMWRFNSDSDEVPPIPPDCRLLRLHVGGDFDTVGYVENWTYRIRKRSDVVAWVYTRSWRVPELLPALEELRALPNVQVFASMDSSISSIPPAGWRRAWIDGDPRAGKVLGIVRHGELSDDAHNQATLDGMPTYVCPEDTGRKQDCQECGYCFFGKRNDVTFLRH